MCGSLRRGPLSSSAWFPEYVCCDDTALIDPGPQDSATVNPLWSVGLRRGAPHARGSLDRRLPLYHGFTRTAARNREKRVDKKWH